MCLSPSPYGEVRSFDCTGVLSQKLLLSLQVAAQQAAALKEDPSAFDYDSVYDSIQEKRVQPQQAEKLERKSRYIDGLLSKAKEREREQDIVYERR